MLGFGSLQRFYIYTAVADMRNGCDGLSGIVRSELDGNPMNGGVYVFFNKTRTTVKMLVWDRDGYAVYSKRLERGNYELLNGIIEGKSSKISYQHLVMLLSGISLVGLRQKPRYQMPELV